MHLNTIFNDFDEPQHLHLKVLPSTHRPTPPRAYLVYIDVRGGVEERFE